MPPVRIFAEPANVGVRRFALRNMRLGECAGAQLPVFAQAGFNAFLRPGGSGGARNQPYIVERGGAGKRMVMRFLGAAKDRGRLHGTGLSIEEASALLGRLR